MAVTIGGGATAGVPLLLMGHSAAQSIATVMTRINLLVVGASVTTFISSGVVDFRLGIPLFVGCAAGGWLGAWVARVTNPKRMKAAFQAFTLLLGAKLLWEAWAAG